MLDNGLTRKKLPSEKVLDSLEELLVDDPACESIIYSTMMSHERGGYSALITSLGMLAANRTDIGYDILDCGLPLLISDSLKSEYANISAGVMTRVEDYHGALAALQCSPIKNRLRSYHEFNCYFMLGHRASLHKAAVELDSELSLTTMTMVVLSMDDDLDTLMDFVLEFGGFDVPAISTWPKSPFITRFVEHPKYDKLVAKLDGELEEAVANARKYIESRGSAS